MITAGVDLGIENVKVVILDGKKVVGRGQALSGGANRAESAETAFHQALKTAGLQAGSVEATVSTGQGKRDVRAAKKQITEPTADTAVVKFLFPKATAVVDLGADQVRVVTLRDGQIVEAVLNQKCAAGIGIFLKSMARTLGLSQESMAGMSDQSSGIESVSDGCCVFAELDAVKLIHKNVPITQIVQAIHNAMAVRINSVLNDKIIPDPHNTVLVGGLAKNRGIVEALKKRSGIDFIIPGYPEFGGALGCALIAQG